jgi:hypothetical protein
MAGRGQVAGSTASSLAANRVQLSHSALSAERPAAVTFRTAFGICWMR